MTTKTAIVIVLCLAAVATAVVFSYLDRGG